MKNIEVSETVLFYDTDCGGVVSNIAYLRFVEKARAALFSGLGMGLAEMNESQLFPVVVRTEIDYIFPAKLGDEVVITASLANAGKVRAVCEFTLTVAGNDGASRVIANAKQTVALVQMPSGRPKRLPGEWVGSTDSAI
ncbi:MAG: thioesterase family protein [Verrucomicrobiales bacterium]|nr:thioesterase family protein [Verrucomicrobiales bacterium]